MDLLGTIVSTFNMTPMLEYVDASYEKYSFQRDDGVLIPLDGASFLEPPHGKVGIFFKTFDASYQLPTTEFLDQVLHNNGVNIYEITPNDVNKVVA